MIVRLLTRRGETVALKAIPQFDAPPAVIVWGARVFIRTPRAGIDDYGAWRYDEVFAYYLADAVPLKG